MVADITQAERKADEMRGALLPTSRLQLSFGAHVVVTMFTGWAATYYGTKYYLNFDDVWVSGSVSLQPSCIPRACPHVWRRLRGIDR
jgi:hypothetical protein